MSDQGERADPTPRRPRKVRFTLLRLILPGLSVTVGLYLAIRGAIFLGAGGDPLYIVVGAGLIVLGLVAFVVGRRRAKRGS